MCNTGQQWATMGNIGQQHEKEGQNDAPDEDEYHDDDAAPCPVETWDLS